MQIILEIHAGFIDRSCTILSQCEFSVTYLVTDLLEG